MGVDYMNCSWCNQIFCDCGFYRYCEGCESVYCEYCNDELYESFTIDTNEYDEEAVVLCPKCDPFLHMTDRYEP